MNKVLKSIFFLLLLQFNEGAAQKQIDHYIIGRSLNLPKSISSFQLKENKLIISSEGYFHKDTRKLRFNTLMIDSIIVNSVMGIKGRITFDYDRQGRLKSFIISQLSNNVWKNEQKITNEYNGDGLLVSALHELYLVDTLVNDINEIFIYDSLGRNSIHEIKHWQNGKWEDRTKVINQFGLDSKVIESITRVYIDDQWVNAAKNSRKYFINGNLANVTLCTWENNSWINFVQTEFHYLRDDLLDFSESQLWAGEYWENYALLKYSYPNGIKVVRGTYYIWRENQWEYDSRFTYNYNLDRYFLDGKFEYYNSGVWLDADGPIHVLNPDGFELHFLTNEMQVFYKGITDVERDVSSLQYKLSQNFPNPFNPTTKINYTIPKRGNVILKVYDVLGCEIAELVNEVKDGGNYQVTFNAENLNSGVYFYTIQSGQFKETKKLLLVK